MAEQEEHEVGFWLPWEAVLRLLLLHKAAKPGEGHKGMEGV